MTQERKLLEEKIKDERSIIQKQAEITEKVNLQKMELIQDNTPYFRKKLIDKAVKIYNEE